LVPLIPERFFWRQPSNEFSQQGYRLIYKDPDGRELTVGRVFRLACGERPCFWGVESFQGRRAPSRTKGGWIC